MGLDAAGFEHALDRGLDYVFWTQLRTGSLRPVLAKALAKDRERYVIATGPSVGWFGVNVRRGAESILRELGTDYIDVFQLFWLGKTSAWTSGTVDALTKLKEEGKIRTIGISIHDRPRAGEMARTEAERLRMFMLRYNAAHPGAEKDVFPHMAAGEAKQAVVAYTATSWRRLLKKPSAWTGAPMTAGDCYRFCLTSPFVDVVLMGAKSVREVDENLAAIEKGPLSSEEESWMRSYGKMVHG
ncbi:MAG: aldo/keto reductase [Deltaproteobacteria bacterium]|nr:aldo/keto reductase [Deltaproteobacteria bacterium]